MSQLAVAKEDLRRLLADRNRHEIELGQGSYQNKLDKTKQRIRELEAV